MKTILGFVLFTMCVSVAIAQTPIRSQVINLGSSTVQWDSIGTGGTYSKYIDVISLSNSDSLFICTENDTLNAGKIYLPPGITWRWVDSPARWIRTKASASPGTISRQIVITVGIPRKGL